MSGLFELDDGRHSVDGSGGDGGFPQQPGETGNIALDMLLAPFQALAGPEVGG